MVGKIDPTPANPGKPKHEIAPHVVRNPLPHPSSVAHLYENGANPYRHEPVLTSPRAAIDPATGLPANPSRLGADAPAPVAATPAPVVIVAAPEAVTDPVTDPVVTPPPASKSETPAGDTGASPETQADAPADSDAPASAPAAVAAPAAPQKGKSWKDKAQPQAQPTPPAETPAT